MRKQKNYKIRVTLVGFKREINRVFLVNDDMKLETFAKVIIYSMNGYCGHMYLFEYNGYNYSFYQDEYTTEDVYAVNLTLKDMDFFPKDKLLLWYDFGDDWYFEITINEVREGHNKKDVELIKGKGCGICEDCGGVQGLYDLIHHTYDGDDAEEFYEFYDYDINDFNLEENDRFVNYIAGEE